MDWAAQVKSSQKLLSKCINRAPSRGHRARSQGGRKVGSEWAKSCSPVAKSCVGCVYMRRCAIFASLPFSVARKSFFSLLLALRLEGNFNRASMTDEACGLAAA